MALIGERGPGKTQMGVALIRDNSERGKVSHYTTAMEIFLALKASYRSGATESEAEILKRFTNPTLLVIDEMQERGETAWEDRLLTHLIDKRYGSERDTLLISNLKQEDFMAALGPSIVSRLIETGGVVNCNWPSFRTHAA